MATALPIAALELSRVWENLEKAAVEELAAALVPGLSVSISMGTPTPEAIESFLQQLPDLPPVLKAYLLSRKAGLLLRQGQVQDALSDYDEALKTEETPSAWALKGAALLQLDRIDEAIQAFQQAYSLKEKFGRQKQEYLRDLFRVWSAAAFLKGLTAILEENVQMLSTGVQEYLEVQERAGNEGIKGAEVKLVLGADAEAVPQQVRDAIEEWELAVRLLSIKDPFEGWRALTKEISKVWPADVSAVDAIREQRDREWNT